MLVVTATPGEPSITEPPGVTKPPLTQTPLTPIPIAPPTVLPQPEVQVELLGQIGGASEALAIHGQYAYLGVGPRLAVVEVSSPSNPRVIGQSAVLSGVVQAVALVDDYAYVAARGAGLYVIDVRDPTRPREENVLDIRAITSIAIAGNYAYVASGHSCVLDAEGSVTCEGSLRVMDLSDPAKPQEVGLIDTRGGARSIAVSGEYVYVVAGKGVDLAGGLRVVDVSDPASPHLVGSLNTESARGVAVVVAGNYAYVAGDSLLVIDISLPASPRKVGSLGAFEGYDDLAVTGRYIYLLNHPCELGRCASNLWFVDVQDPAAPQYVQSIPSGSESGIGVGRAVAVLNGLVYWARDAGLEIWDVSQSGKWRLIGQVSTIGSVSNMSVVNGYVYVQACMSGQESLHVVDVQNPGRPVAIGQCQNCAASANGLVVKGGYAYLGIWEFGLQIVDVRDPSDLHRLGSLKLGEPGLAGVYDVAFLGDRYVGMVIEDRSLRVVDVTNPASPRQAASLKVQAGGYHQIVEVDRIAYVAAGACGESGCQGQLKIIDIADPTAPRLMGSLDVPGATDVAIAGSYAYVPTELCYYTYPSCSSELWVIDVTNPTRPRQLSTLTMPVGARDVAVGGKYVYWGQRIIDVTDPTQPREVGRGRPLEGRKVVIDNYIYVAGGDTGLLILRVSPAMPGGS